MSITGKTLGNFEITSQLGKGGMGVVYQAKDQKLGRDVAIKVLPEEFARDADRVARFQREAKLLASLNHPNIAAIYGLEESGGTNFLVLELVEGDTLADRIKAGPVPVEEALKLALQIVEALEAAHEKGVIHRDLKPANIKLTPDGKVKVLDFGLAKVGGTPAVSSENSPTLSVAQTAAGVILGTAAYMSPEQAKGKTVDKRADIWSFGVVLYEMLTGKQLFAGETISDILAAVIKEEVDWGQVPAKVRPLLHRCLEKDPKRRLRDIGDAMPLLDGVPESAPGKSPFLAWSVVVVLLLAISLVSVLYFRQKAPALVVTRLVIPLPAGQEITDSPAVSPDGRIIAYAAKQGSEEPQLFLHDLNAFDAKPVVGTKGASQPFFSSDSRWVAFFAQGQLLKAEVSGGSPAKIADAAVPFGGSWGDDDTIVFTTALNSGLLRIPAGGGQPETLTKPDGAAAGYAHVWPQFLPGGHNVLFTVWGKGYGDAMLSLETHRWQSVLSGVGGAQYATSGHLLVGDGVAGLRAASFDPVRPVLTRADSSVLDNVYHWSQTERPWLATSRTGTVVYVPGSPARHSLAWVDRQGRTDPLGMEQAEFLGVTLSPDGSKAIVNKGKDLWIHDLRQGTVSRLTSAGDNTNNESAIWADGGTRVVFSSNRNGDWDLYSQPADGSRPPELLLKRQYDQFPLSQAPDGTLVFIENHPGTGDDLWTLSRDGKASPFRVTPFNEGDAQFSPNGRYLAYASNDSGRMEIYVQPFPGPGERIAVSAEGGKWPLWSRDGKELFYWAGDAIMAVEVQTGGVFSMGGHRRLFDSSGFHIFFNQTYDISPDGKRFLMIRRDAGSVPRQLNVILNWFQELKQIMAVEKGK